MQILSIARRLAATAATAAGCALAAGAMPATAAGSPAYVPGQVIVGYSTPPSATVRADIATSTGAQVAASPAPGVELLRLPHNQSVTATAARLRRMADVRYAVPNYIAHESGGWIPDDRGRGGPRSWQLLQWNFLAGAGVDAPAAWANMFRDGAPGGRGVTVAILDTGVAYRNWEGFRESPDFTGTRFAAACDLVAGTITGLSSSGQITSSSRCTDPFALDRQGHGTFVAGVVAESTNNSIGVTGVAYGATIMPVRVLDAEGNGDSLTIARGIRYAATHGARVINLSLEFDMTIGPGDIPDIIEAINFANRHGVIVVAAAGNDGATELAYPARYPLVISVGATTRDRCVASYSDVGPGLDLVAPGGGDDSAVAGGPNCHPERNLPGIYQMTFPDPSNPDQFGLPGGWYGTSMSAPHVAATAALVIASGVLGSRPSPAQVLQRLETTAEPLGGSVPNADYGYGLVDAGAATTGTSRTARTRHATTRKTGRRTSKARRAVK